MGKSWLKIVSLAMFFVLVAPMVYDAFNASAVFVAEAKTNDNNNNNNNKKKNDKDVKVETGSLPLEKVNRDHFFRMVELCIPGYLQKLIRKAANKLIDKLIAAGIGAIPVVGPIFKGIYEALKPVEKVIDPPTFPGCTCEDDDNTQDSAWLPLNWRFAQNYIKEKVDDRRHKKFPKWEENLTAMLVSRDENGKGFDDTVKMDGVGNVLRTVWNDSSYYPNGDPFIKISLSDFDRKFQERYPSYSGIVSVVDEQARLADNWRTFQPGTLKIMKKFHDNIIFEKLEHKWTTAMIKDLFSNRGNRARDEQHWGWYGSYYDENERKNLDPFKDYDTEEKKSGQTRAMQAAAVITKATGDMIERNAYQWALFAEASITAQQNKKSTKQVIRKNIDLMGHHTANKKVASRKVKLGFN